MDFKNIIDLLLKSNISNDDITALIMKASSLDLSDEDNQRVLIRDCCKMANKEITPELEDKIISLLKEKGISNDLFNYIR
ncbi:MAG: stage VI sporulation protein F [Anaeroplasma sp.]